MNALLVVSTAAVCLRPLRVQIFRYFLGSLKVKCGAPKLLCEMGVEMYESSNKIHFFLVCSVEAKLWLMPILRRKI